MFGELVSSPLVPAINVDPSPFALAPAAGQAVCGSCGGFGLAQVATVGAYRGLLASWSLTVAAEGVIATWNAHAL